MTSARLPAAVTQWIETPDGGRQRGPVALLRAWVAVLVRPRRFFETAVTPGDQAPGLVFASAVVLVEEATRFALVPGSYPVFGGRPTASAILVLGVAAALVAPAGLHLVAALQTLLLLPSAPDRGGISETVQVIAYASAPCALAGVPVPGLRLACTLYGAGLLILGTGVVHDLPRERALLLSALPAVVVFGYGFRGYAAAAALGIA